MVKVYIWVFLLCTSSLGMAQDLSSLYQEMMGYYQNKEYAKGIAKRDLFLDLAEKAYGKADTNYASVLNLMGFFYHQSAMYKEAGELYGVSLQLFEQYFGKKHLYYANVAINLADVQTSLRQYTAAEVLYKDALDYHKSTSGEMGYYLTYLPKLAQLYESMQNNKEAASVYRKITTIYRNAYGKQSEYYAYGLFLQGQFYEKTSDLAEAKEMYESALEVYKNKVGEQHTSYAYTLNYLAHVNDLMGHVAEAEVQYNKALDIYKKLEGDSTMYYASILNNLANLYKNTGRVGEAFECYNKVTLIYRKTLGEEHEYYATALNNLAIIFTEKKQLKEAELLYKKVNQIYLKVYGELHPFYAVSLVNIGEFYYRSKRYHDCLEMYNLAADLHLKSGRGQHLDYAATLYKRAWVFEYLNQYARAIEEGEKALDIQIKQLGEKHMSSIMSLAVLGRLYGKNNQTKKAEQAYGQMYDNLIYLIDNYFPTLGEYERTVFYGSIKWMFNDFFSFGAKVYASNVKFGESMYNAQLNTKALLLNSSNRIRNVIKESKDSSLVAMYFHWNSQKEFLGKVFAMTLAEQKEKNIDVAALVDHVSALGRRISLKSVDFASLYAQKPTCKTLQARLKEGEAAIEIIRYDSHEDTSSNYMALVLTKAQAPQLVAFEHGDRMEGRFYSYYSNYIQSKLEDNNSYKHYWEPLEAYLKNIKKIYFSVDGVYNKISIRALQNPDTHKYLNESYDIRLVSNTRELLEHDAEPTMAQLSKSKAYLLGFPDYKATGRPALPENYLSMAISREVSDSLSRSFGEDIPELPGTMAEIEQISLLINQSKIRAQVFTRGEATEENVKAAQNVGILHIATHGFFVKGRNEDEKVAFGSLATENYEESLRRSGLLLAGAAKTISGQGDKNREDGVLSAYEAANLNLNHTALVVLSACETGLGDITNGEGVYGLQRSFCVAGARYVLMSLWKVDDAATQELMVSFYKKWLSSGHIHESFRQAQLELQQKYKEPRYWAAFVLSGI